MSDQEHEPNVDTIQPQSDAASFSRPSSRSAKQDDHSDHPFPPHSGPRVWFLTAGGSPIAQELASRLVDHGDFVAAGFLGDRDEPGREIWRELEKDRGQRDGRGRVKIVDFDIRQSQQFKQADENGRSLAECQSAIAETIQTFGRVDVLLCCHSEAIIGTVEELSQTPSTISLISEQFATNFFGPVNMIKSLLPTFRSQRNGHIVLQTGITGHLGTPGLSIFCASQWAIEGYCDSLAYEIAPFNVKMSIVQSNIEVSLLTNRITAVPAMEPYSPPANTAPLPRGWLGTLGDRLEEAGRDESETDTHLSADNDISGPNGKANPKATAKISALLNDTKNIQSFRLNLPASFRRSLIAETVHALLAIGGHDNPPARHIVGYEGVASVKEKLRTVSEELEDFLECSAAVDY